MEPHGILYMVSLNHEYGTRWGVILLRTYIRLPQSVVVESPSCAVLKFNNQR